MKIIDTNNWARKYYFHVHFDSVISYTAMMDATRIYEYAHRLHLPFSPVLYHACLKAINELEHFRYRIIDKDSVACYDQIDLVSLELSTDHFSYPMFTPYTSSVKDFYQAYRQRRKETKAPREKGDPCVRHLNTVLFNTLSGIRFLSAPTMDLPETRRGMLYVTFGQHERDERGKVTLPVSATFAHSLLDGYDFKLILDYLHNYGRE